MKKIITAALGGALLTSTLLEPPAPTPRCRRFPRPGSTRRAARQPRTGVFNIPEGDENYWDAGVRDGHGIACEKN